MVSFYPVLCLRTLVRGQPHASSTNPEHREVVSVTLQKEDSGRLLSIHVLPDGTVVEKKRGRRRQPTPTGDRENDKDRGKKDEDEGKEGKDKGKDAGKSTDRRGRATVK